MRSFAVECPLHPRVPQSWDLDVVLRHLTSSKCEPLERLSLRALTKKILFLVAVATAKRVGELQALSQQVASQGPDMFISYTILSLRLIGPMPLCLGLLRFVHCESLRGI